MTPEQKADILEILDSAKDITVATVREDGYALDVSLYRTAPYSAMSDCAGSP